MAIVGCEKKNAQQIVAHCIEKLLASHDDHRHGKRTKVTTLESRTELINRTNPFFHELLWMPWKPTWSDMRAFSSFSHNSKFTCCRRVEKKNTGINVENQLKHSECSCVPPPFHHRAPLQNSLVIVMHSFAYFTLTSFGQPLTQTHTSAQIMTIGYP